MTRCKGIGCDKRALFNMPTEIKALYCKKCRPSAEFIDVIHPRCNFEKCNVRPGYNFEGEAKPVRCFNHRDSKMVLIGGTRCLTKDCKNLPYYNSAGQSKPLYCADHADADMQRTCKGVKCIGNGCSKEASFNLPTECKALYCKKCRPSVEYIDVCHARCNFQNCYVRPNYNFEGITPPARCFKHKDPKMVLIGGTRCLTKDCKNLPYYNVAGQKALYCAKHANKDMISIRKEKKCFREGCNKLPSYNKLPETIPLYCKAHIPDESYIDVKHPKCREDNCTVRPTYGNAGDKGPSFCIKHKKALMCDLVSRRCMAVNCKTQPSFNHKGQTKPLWCKEHADTGMIDIINKRCTYKDCNNWPNFNYPSEIRPVVCILHIETGMINVRKNKRCQFDKCKELALFGLLNKRATHCAAHKQPEQINLILYHKCNILDCDNEFELIVDNIKYCDQHIPSDAITQIKRLCQYCDMAENTTHICKDCKMIKNKKEWAVVRHLRKMIAKPFEFDSNKMLGCCTLKRPDVYFECNKHCVIVEIDERQHNAYLEACECARLSEIVGGVRGLSVIIIRYNPDIVRHNGKKIEFSMAERLEKLVQCIRYELNANYDEFVVKLIQLYYDDNEPQYLVYKTENITHIVTV